jgi:hypothetical protein
MLQGLLTDPTVTLNGHFSPRRALGLGLPASADEKTLRNYVSEISILRHSLCVDNGIEAL